MSIVYKLLICLLIITTIRTNTGCDDTCGSNDDAAECHKSTDPANRLDADKHCKKCADSNHEYVKMETYSATTLTTGNTGTAYGKCVATCDEGYFEVKTTDGSKS